MNQGLLIYGYTKNEAETLLDDIISLVQKPLFVRSASGKESDTIETIINSSANPRFVENDTKILMFVNMTDPVIQKILSSFPSSVPKPIFCGLTKHNIKWSFHELKEHLLEEKAYWEKQKNQK